MVQQFFNIGHTVLLLALWLFSGVTVSAQEDLSELRGAAERYEKALQTIATDERHWAERESLAQRALKLAQQEPDSPEAEQLFHWVLSSPRSSPAALEAAKGITDRHLTSTETMRRLLSYARSPREWTPDLFAAYGDQSLTSDRRRYVDFCSALHQKSLLELADRIQLNKEDLVSALGPQLAKRLQKLDRDALETQVIATFSILATESGDAVVAGMKMKELAEGSAYFVRNLRLGKSPDGFTGKSLSGDSITLKNYQGKVVMIDFWATWCAPCVHELPSLKQLAADYQGLPFSLIGVSEDEDRQRLRDFVVEHEVEWPTIQDVGSKLSARWQALSLPTYYVLDQAHVVRYYGSDASEARNTVKKLLPVDDQAATIANLVAATLQALDTNNDKRLDRDELPLEQRDILKTADLDNNGSLSIDELTQFTKATLRSKVVEAKSPESP